MANTSDNGKTTVNNVPRAKFLDSSTLEPSIQKGNAQENLKINLILRFKTITYLFNYSMKQCPFGEANRFSVSQEIPRILWNLKVHYSVYKCSLFVPVPNQINPVHAPSHFLNIYLNIILLSMPGSSKWCFSVRFPIKTLHATILSPIRATCPIHLILLDLIIRIIFSEEYRSLSSSLCNFPHSRVTSSHLGPNILLSTLFSNTFSLHSSLNVSDQVSHPYKTTDKIIVLYILIFIFLYFWIANWWIKDSAPNNRKHSMTSICP